MAAIKMTASEMIQMYNEERDKICKRMDETPLFSVAHTRATVQAYFSPLTALAKVAKATLGFGSR